MPVEEIVIDARGKGMMAFTLDQHEMVVEVFEAMTLQRRPAGISSTDAYDEIKERSPEAFAICVRVSTRMLDYMGEQMRNARLEAVQ